MIHKKIVDIEYLFDLSLCLNGLIEGLVQLGSDGDGFLGRVANETMAFQLSIVVGARNRTSDASKHRRMLRI